MVAPTLADIQNLSDDIREARVSLVTMQGFLERAASKTQERLDRIVLVMAIANVALMLLAIFTLFTLALLFHRL